MNEHLDELQAEAEKLLRLLKDREVGLFTWWEFLSKGLKAISEIDNKLGKRFLSK